MNQARKNQLNNKLHQIYTNGSGRIEGVIEETLQEYIGGHVFFLHKIKGTIKHLPIEEYDEIDKSYTRVEVGLYQEGNACIATFDIPYSEKELQKIGARIDFAYYKWMQREPSSLKLERPYDYYKDIVTCSNAPTFILTEEQFYNSTEEEQQKIIHERELQAFFPIRDN